MKPFVTVTQEDLEAIFEKWDKQAVEGEWDKKPYNPKGQAEHFMLLANERIDAEANIANLGI